MTEKINLQSVRARKARLRKSIGQYGQRLLFTLAGSGYVGAAILHFLHAHNFVFLTISAATIALVFALWHRYDLSELRADYHGKTLDSVIEPRFLGNLRGKLTPRRVWLAAIDTLEGRFVANHLLIDSKQLAETLSDESHDMNIVWFETAKLYELAKPHDLHAGIIAAAIILNSPVAKEVMRTRRMRSEDAGEVLNWLERQLTYMRAPKPYFGGIGRDWASGYTPNLDSFSTNVSAIVEKSDGGAGFMAHNDLITTIGSALGRGNAVALVGEDGVGKSDLVRGLAQHLLEAKTHELQYHQIVSLNAAHIVSFSGRQLEGLILTLFGEAVAAGNMILFLDDAELFFSDGVGAFDMSQLLLPLLKNRNVHVITSFTPGGWQALQASRPALTSSMMVVNVKEPNEKDTYKIVEDSALMLEYRSKLIVSYEAIREAYRLSGQYLQEQSYPKKAISLLEQAAPYADGNALTANSVQAAIEHTKGIKVSEAAAPEADMLLHLEERIHERMIDQAQAVSAVASALRRGRAGVANPKRPVGSFLFLGPTGVGKTELAKSLAAVYFGDEHQMIRLDMSEYQTADDVERLLAVGSQHESSLLMRVREQPFSVILLDEIEKAHPNILNLLLQILDEGQLTDEQGRTASFRSSIIIATSNAGAKDITEQVRAKNSLSDFSRTLINTLISQGTFKPELVNRFDDIVLFGPLGEKELEQVAMLMIADVNRTLESKQISVELTPKALAQITKEGYDPEFGARPMRRAIQRLVEDAVAGKILRQEASAGSHIILDEKDLTS